MRTHVSKTKPTDEAETQAELAKADAEEHAALAPEVETLEEGRALLLAIQERIGELEKTRKYLKAPALEAGRRIDGLFKPAINRFEGVKAALKQWMDRKLAEEREAQRKALAEASTREQVVAAVAATPEVRTRTYEEIEIDETKLPREYLKPDETKIRLAISMGATIPGVTVRVVESVVAR
jgi:hypothetical protein